MSQRAAKIKLCRKVSLTSHVWADAKIGMGVLKGEPAIVGWHAQTWEESDTAALCDIYDGSSAGHRL